MQRRIGTEVLTVFCQNEPNRYWTEVPAATDGCHRNIGARKGNEFICYPMGILQNGVWLQREFLFHGSHRPPHGQADA